MYFVSLEMVRYAFVAPRLGRKVPLKRNFGVSWLRDRTTTLQTRAPPTTKRAPPLWWGMAPLVVGGSLKYFTPNIDRYSFCLLGREVLNISPFIDCSSRSVFRQRLVREHLNMCAFLFFINIFVFCFKKVFSYIRYDSAGGSKHVQSNLLCQKYEALSM